MKNKNIVEDIDDLIQLTNFKRHLKTTGNASTITKLKRTNINTNEISQVGGYDKPEQAPYRSERNTPFLSNDQRDTYKKRSAENPIREPPIILEQKVYDTSQRPAPKPQFPPTFIPLYDQSGSVANHLLPYTHVMNQPPVQKVYNINVSNPLTSHTSINRIYEDILPGEQNNFSALTIFERNQLINFLRNSMLTNNDGEDMNGPNGSNSLLSYIKMMDINPYSVKKNPYTDLPRNFLLYRSGYPVRFDEKTKNIGLAKTSMGINVRIYRMSLGDLRCHTINKDITAENFDLWREIKYYDWVRDELIKRKVSPNFICPILYKIDTESKIDWPQLELLKSKTVPSSTITQLKSNDLIINTKHNLDKNLSFFQTILPNQLKTKKALNLMPNNKQDLTLDSFFDTKAKTKDLALEDKEDLTLNSGKSLVLLTEAPTSSLIQWASSIYESFGTVKKMISTGYHVPNVWKAVLFQLVYVYAILQEKGIYIRNVSLENNIYIKDIFSEPKAIGSWIYKVDNIEYYIPNYGYVLMFDSKYSDIETDISLVPNPATKVEQKFKMHGSIYTKNSSLNNTDLKPFIRMQFKELIHVDNFSHNFRVKGGTQPDDEILNLLKNMTDDSEPDIKKYIAKYFKEFLHNRVGTLLLKSEKDNINMFSRPNFQKGNLMIWQKRYQEYEWVIYLEHVSTNLSQIKILYKNNNNIDEQIVHISSLYSYPENEKILPETKQNLKYDENNIYETYNFDNLNMARLP